MNESPAFFSCCSITLYGFYCMESGTAFCTSGSLKRGIRCLPVKSAFPNCGQCILSPNWRVLQPGKNAFIPDKYEPQRSTDPCLSIVECCDFQAGGQRKCYEQHKIMCDVVTVRVVQSTQMDCFTMPDTFCCVMIF